MAAVKGREAFNLGCSLKVELAGLEDRLYVGYEIQGGNVKNNIDYGEHWLWES